LKFHRVRSAAFNPWNPITMTSEPIRFSDGAGYDRFMGVWSRLAGQDFLDWIGPSQGQRWLDVGCGNGAFTQLIAEQCEPLRLVGIDPSEAQLAYARQQPLLQSVDFVNADAMALPFPDDAFDLAVMPLVIFFVPEPAQGVAEMARVVAPGGTVAAYAWDLEGGGFPYQSVNETLGAVGRAVPMPPSAGASRLDGLRDLWTSAGLGDIHTRVITVERTYTDFDDLWATVLGGPSAGQALAVMGEADVTRFRELLRDRLQPAGSGSITLAGRAHAIRGTRDPRGGARRSRSSPGSAR
jgi:SAM-dependent methyltransferase